MINHVNELLGSYLDGELGGLRLRQVESHLAECAACRSELESLRSLSALLQETPPAADFTPTERFVANLTLRLPRRAEAPASRKALQVGWWLIPAGVLGAWVFIQVLTAMASLVSTADQAGLLGNVSALLQGSPQQTGWFTAAQSLFGEQLSANGLTTLEVLNQADLFVWDFIIKMTWQIGLVVLYWGWLAIWWLRRREKPAGQAASQLPRATA